MRPLAYISAALSVIAIICTALPLGAATMTPADFPYKADLTGTTVRNGLYRAVIGPDVLARCSDGCTRARIFDTSRREIPFVVHREKSGAAVVKERPLTVRSLEEKDGRSTIILERQSGTPEMVNRLKVATAARDFHKQVIVEGSDDRTKWEVLGEDRIYDFSSQVPLRHTEIVLKDNAFRFLRFIMKDSKGPDKAETMKLKYGGLEFSTAGMEQKKTISIDAFTASLHKKESEAMYDQAEVTPTVKNDGKPGTTELTFDTLLPVETIVFGIDDPYYLRTVTVYGSKTGKSEDMVRLGGSTLHKLTIAGTQEMKDSIDVGGGSGFRYYRVVIENGTNPPLQIAKTTLKWARRQLYFVALDDNRRYSLYAGNASAVPVNYDIAAVITADNREEQPAQELRFSSPLQNDLYRPSRDSDEKGRIEKILLISVVILLVVVVGFFLYRLWKKA